MRISDEKGVALILALFLMVALSVVSASLMFLSQTETHSSINYRLMSQARYGAEAGLQRAANYLLYTYAPPTTGGADPVGNYTYVGVSPVTFNGQPVVLSADPDVPANYPVPAVQTAFANAALGTLPAGETTVTYAPVATLLMMKQMNTFGGGIETIQTWRITSQGTVTLGRPARVELTAVLETLSAPAEMYAAFATSGGCGALNFHGHTVRTDSYDSTAPLVGGAPVLDLSGGSVGTNGNLTEGGGATINGSLSTPRVGVGDCSDGNVTALSASGGATVTEGVVQLPQAVTLPAPDPPNPLPPTTAFNGNGQTLLDGASVGNVSVNAGQTLTLGAPGVTSVIDINSITLNGNAELVILGTVVLNVAGTGEGTPIDFTGGAVTNASFDPANFQVLYGGAGTVKLNGGSSTAAMVYAPDAAIEFSGNADFYGSVVGATVDDTGGMKIHYDRNLAGKFYTIGNPMMTSFGWSRF